MVNALLRRGMASRNRLKSGFAIRQTPYAAGLAIGILLSSHGIALAHGEKAAADSVLFKCKTSGTLGDKSRVMMSAPFDEKNEFKALQQTALWRNIVAHLHVNRDKAKPCFSFSDQDSWTSVVSKVPSNVVAVQASIDRNDAIIYVSGMPDYRMEMPKMFSSFKPGETYGIFRVSVKPEADTRNVHEFASRGTIGIFVNGVSMFNYTDTFAYENKGIWSYDANVAEAPIVNTDISHATPSNLPQFPKSRGIFHNHQVSTILLRQLKDPFVSGKREHSRLIGFAIDSNPIFGPLGYTSRDKSSGLKVLRSSYLQRGWLSEKGTGNRSSVPGWVVRNWDNSHAKGTTLLNLFEKNKADVLYSDGATSGEVTYTGTDTRMASEIKALQALAGLKRDELGYVYWESKVVTPGGKAAMARNYLLKTSDLWGPSFSQKILPASYQIADIDKFYFVAKLGSFAEDYEFIEGFGDLDFYNGIDSYLPDRKESAYHYVTPFSTSLRDKNRLHGTSFPYFIGMQYKSKVSSFNASLDMKGRTDYFSKYGKTLNTLFDLGVVGKDDANAMIKGSVVETWQKTLSE